MKASMMKMDVSMILDITLEMKTAFLVDAEESSDVVLSSIRNAIAKIPPQRLVMVSTRETLPCDGNGFEMLAAGSDCCIRKNSPEVSMTKKIEVSGIPRDDRPYFDDGEFVPYGDIRKKRDSERFDWIKNSIDRLQKGFLTDSLVLYIGGELGWNSLKTNMFLHSLRLAQSHSGDLYSIAKRMFYDTVFWDVYDSDLPTGSPLFFCHE